MKSKWILGMLIGGLYGCSMFQSKTLPNGSSTDNLVNFGSEVASGGYGVLPMVGGISIIGGVILLFISRGVRGWIPLLAGVGLVVLNIILLEYLAAIAIPALILSGCVGLGWTWQIVEGQFFRSK